MKWFRRSSFLCIQVFKNVSVSEYFCSVFCRYNAGVCVCVCVNMICCKHVCVYVCVFWFQSLHVCVWLRHGRCFWFSGQSGGDHCKAGVSEGGVTSMHGFGAVWSQDAAILPHASRDGQSGLIPHGFRERELCKRWRGHRKEVERWFVLKKKKKNSSQKHGNHLINAIHSLNTWIFLLTNMPRALTHACACAHNI